MPLAAWSQEADAGAEQEAEEVPSNRLILTPMLPPVPAMKYELLPPAIERVPGNAAVFYGKVKSEQNHFFSSTDISKKNEIAQTRPLKELKNNHELDYLLHLGMIFDSLHEGARCTHVDWQLPIRKKFFSTILLPEVQESRTFSRLLQGRARLQIARADFDGAVVTLQTGFALARHVAEGETLINGLVGVAEVNSMLDVVQEFISQPDAPNLYWALATSPIPWIDLRPGLEAEYNALYWTETGWREPEKLEGDERFWRKELVRLSQHLNTLVESDGTKLNDAQLTALVVSSYPAAKKRLLDRGFNQADVEAMPVAKVIMLDVLHQYNRNRDTVFARVIQALREPTKLTELAITSEQVHPETLPVSKSLATGTIQYAVQAVVSLERRAAALQVVEAIRLYAASHDRQLPEKLEDITLVKVPNDPVTGAPFHYEQRNGIAVISSPELRGVPLRLELSIADAQGSSN